MPAVAAVICVADAVAAVDDVEPAPPTGMPFSSLHNITAKKITVNMI